MWQKHLISNYLEKVGKIDRHAPTPHSTSALRGLNKAVLEPQVSPAFTITYFCNHCNIRFLKRRITPNYPEMTFDPHLLSAYTCESTQGSMKRHHWPFKRSIPRMTPDDLWPHICWSHMCDSTQESLGPTPMEIYQSIWIQWPFFKNVN